MKDQMVVDGNGTVRKVLFNGNTYCSITRLTIDLAGIGKSTKEIKYIIRHLPIKLEKA